MKSPRSLFVGLVALTALALLAPGVRAEDVPSFRKRGDQEKKFASEVCIAILKAAHGTGQEPTMDRHEYKNPKPGRTELVMKGTFKGKLTGKLYTADMTVIIDSTDKDSWEVLRIDYSDNATIPWNKTNVMELVKKFNK